MSQIKKYTEELRRLPKSELLTVFFNLLESGSVSFSEISKVYVDFLEQKNKDNSDLICELGMSLVMFKDKITGGTWQQAEEKANKAILRTNLFKGTEYEKKLLKSL